MKRRILIAMLLFAAAAQAQSDPWAALRVFEGKWEGTVTGKPGKQISNREYHFEYNGKFHGSEMIPACDQRANALCVEIRGDDTDDRTRY